MSEKLLQGITHVTDEASHLHRDEPTCHVLKLSNCPARMSMSDGVVEIFRVMEAPYDDQLISQFRY